MANLAEQHRREFERRANEILREIDRLLVQQSGSRDEDLEDSDLLTAKSHVVKLRDRVLVGGLPPKSERYAVMTRIIVDQWPLATRLGNSISELESFFALLEEA